MFQSGRTSRDRYFQSPVPTHTLSCNVVVIIADMEPVRFLNFGVNHVVCTLSVSQMIASHVTNTSPELPYSSVENNFYLKEITKTSTLVDAEPLYRQNTILKPEIRSLW